MKLRLLITIATIPIAIACLCSGCETSEGLKYGTLQKVSHKTFPCNYYVAEFAFEGGKSTGSSDSKAFENTQLVEIDKACYDTLQSHLGDKCVFDYKDKGFAACGESKKLTSFTIKKQ